MNNNATSTKTTLKSIKKINASRKNVYKKKKLRDVLTNLPDEYIKLKFKVTTSIKSELQKHFVWNVGFQMTPVEKSTFNQTENNKKYMSLFFFERDFYNRRYENTVKETLHVKQSTIPNAGLGLFASMFYNKDDVIAIYFGKKNKKTQEKHSKESHIYSFQVKPGIILTPHKDDLFLGSQFINDYNMGNNESFGIFLTNNAYFNGILLVAKRKRGSEITADYGINYNE